MKRNGTLAVGIAASALMLAAQPAFAQAGGGSKGAGKSEAGGRTTPSDQPSTAPAPTVPTGDVALGSVRLPKAVMADGNPGTILETNAVQAAARTLGLDVVTMNIRRAEEIAPAFDTSLAIRSAYSAWTTGSCTSSAMLQFCNEFSAAHASSCGFAGTTSAVRCFFPSP